MLMLMQTVRFYLKWRFQQIAQNLKQFCMMSSAIGKLTAHLWKQLEYTHALSIWPQKSVSLKGNKPLQTSVCGRDPH